MKEIEFFRKNLIALTLVAGVAFAGCVDGDEGMGDEGLGDDGLGNGAEVEPGQAEPGYETQEQAQRMGTATPFAELDANTDNRVTREEFQAYARDRRVFERWDENSDGMYGQDEFDAIGFDDEVGDYEAWDTDGNGSLGADEFWGSVFGAFDDNEDGHWDAGEWDDAGDSGLFDI